MATWPATWPRDEISICLQRALRQVYVSMSASLLAALAQRAIDGKPSPPPPTLTRQLTLGAPPLVGRVLGQIDLFLLIMARLPRWTPTMRMAKLPPS